MNTIYSDLQKLLRYFNASVTVAFLKIIRVPSATLFCNNLPAYLNGFKLSLFTLSLLKLVGSLFHQKHKLSVTLQ